MPIGTYFAPVAVAGSIAINSFCFDHFRPQISQNLPKLLQCRLQIFHDLRRNHLRRGQIIRIRQRLILEPEDSEQMLVGPGLDPAYYMPSTRKVSRSFLRAPAYSRAGERARL